MLVAVPKATSRPLEILSVYFRYGSYLVVLDQALVDHKNGCWAISRWVTTACNVLLFLPLLLVLSEEAGYALHSVCPSVSLSCACAIYWSCWQHCTDVPFNWRLPTAATAIFHTLLRTNKHKMNLWLAALHKKLCIDLREFFTKGNFKLISLWKWSRLIHCHLEVTVAQQVGHFGLKWL